MCPCRPGRGVGDPGVDARLEVREPGLALVGRHVVGVVGRLADGGRDGVAGFGSAPASVRLRAIAWVRSIPVNGTSVIGLCPAVRSSARGRRPGARGAMTASWGTPSPRRRRSVGCAGPREPCRIHPLHAIGVGDDGQAPAPRRRRPGAAGQVPHPHAAGGLPDQPPQNFTVHRVSPLPSWSCAVGVLSPDRTPARQLDVDGVEVDVADVLEQLRGPRAGQGLGVLVAPRLVLALQGAELGEGRSPPGRPGLRPGRPGLPDGDAGVAALTVPSAGVRPESGPGRRVRRGSAPGLGGQGPSISRAISSRRSTTSSSTASYSLSSGNGTGTQSPPRRRR